MCNRLFVSSTNFQSFHQPGFSLGLNSEKTTGRKDKVCCVSTSSNTASTSTECCHCKRTFEAESLSSHQRKCMDGLSLKCPDCLEVISLQKWLDEHECQKERPEAGLEQNSENTCVEACTQTEEENDLYTKVYMLHASTEHAHEGKTWDFMACSLLSGVDLEPCKSTT